MAARARPPIVLVVLMLNMLLFVSRSMIIIMAETEKAESDSAALLALKRSIDVENRLAWREGSDPCTWAGVKECMRGRVTKLVAENYGLTGHIDGPTLARLDQLRLLSFKFNNLSGPIPTTLSKLVNLKSLYLNHNLFTGAFPESLTSLHRLKIIVLSGNNLSGRIPPSIVNLHRLYLLYLDNNKFVGGIPPLNQSSLKFLNLSNNLLSGEIPKTSALTQFNHSSFAANVNICGPQIGLECSPNGAPGPALPMRRRSRVLSRKAKILIGAISGGVFILLLVACLVILVSLSLKRRRRRRSKEAVAETAVAGESEGREKRETAAALASSSRGGGGGGDRKGFSWEGERLGRLVFIGEEVMSYSLEDLLKASAETLGRGTVGSTYKAVMESGYIVTVKRLKDARYPQMEEFRRQVEVLGMLNHPNLVPLRAYFQAKEERLLVFDYFPNGSLFSLIHGNRPSGGGKPLHWTSCLKIAEDIATGIVYIHQSFGLVHGNLKSSNVLLGSDFESCLTDYGLQSFRNPESTEEPSAASLFYRAPECRDPRKLATQPADVYSFGVLLLELMTGKTPFQDLVQEHGTDIPKWVRSVREEETESGEGSSGNETAEEKLNALLNIAMTCVGMVPDSRPQMKEVLRMIRDTRAEAQISSNNSSDHSPGRWSDTVQSLPRDEQSSI